VDIRGDPDARARTTTWRVIGGKDFPAPVRRLMKPSLRRCSRQQVWGGWMVSTNILGKNADGQRSSGRPGLIQTKEESSSACWNILSAAVDTRSFTARMCQRLRISNYVPAPRRRQQRGWHHIDIFGDSASDAKSRWTSYARDSILAAPLVPISSYFWTWPTARGYARHQGGRGSLRVAEDRAGDCHPEHDIVHSSP